MRAKKMRQDGVAEFISASLIPFVPIRIRANERNPIHLFDNIIDSVGKWDKGRGR
ncbi:hypothetical protein GCM10008919_17080 [Selenomonas dianae]|uniref:Uncharacterized protein n=1 Tax=Selenomonas dianae TaxID=135079 RepID=A0ABN0T7E2_9FIRM